MQSELSDHEGQNVFCQISRLHFSLPYIEKEPINRGLQLSCESVRPLDDREQVLDHRNNPCRCLKCASIPKLSGVSTLEFAELVSY